MPISFNCLIYLVHQFIYYEIYTILIANWKILSGENWLFQWYSIISGVGIILDPQAMQNEIGATLEHKVLFSYIEDF